MRYKHARYVDLYHMINHTKSNRILNISLWIALPMKDMKLNVQRIKLISHYSLMFNTSEVVNR